MQKFQFHNMALTWLDGGTTYLDGGTMFGVVPKVIWSKRYPVNEKNQIELPTHPILVQYEGHNILIDSGLGAGKLTERQLRNLGVSQESRVEEDLAELGLTPEDIDTILMTHLHGDHAAGLTKWQGEELVSAFPNATIHVSATEWNEMQHPNIRSRNTYWKENWEPITGQVETFEGEKTLFDAITLIHTGGHSDGHSVIKMQSGDETILHMADIMPTHAHQNPLWVLAFDDYPMDSIYAKEKLMKEALENGYYFSFYHDAYYRILKWSVDGKEIVESLERKEKVI
ncbi:MBL fold metallo-hydrolase [Microbacterium sp. APC 3898]|uniref:MBL fold metallo-hydrolase n=1 Tax=Planococcus notacanthi TaxID=3035188 RepID=A0ABT7ZK63_9BACL|nr:MULTISPECIES: MBL fold metallo-hydrolase [Terrabacteria group]MDN3427077.1 MBL fold metallo-hydrolase [Planococcus sp. APC 4016]MDN3439632.1 MBL fold metallo-hydrolase [Planococcus sp. APC 3900]MDN3499773.1 MBL fold metallo-hydrolase [Microbacterium sp. APC 3898]